MRRILPLLLLVLAGCGDQGIVAWEALTTTEASTPSTATTTTEAPHANLEPPPDLGIESLDDLVNHLALVSPPSSYHFHVLAQQQPGSVPTVYELEGNQSGDDFYYTIQTAGAPAEVLHVDGTLWGTIDGQWAIPTDQELPPDVFSFFYARGLILIYVEGDSRIEPIEPGETDGQPTAGYRAEVPTITDSNPLGGSRTIDMWFNADGLLVRLVVTTVPPPDVVYAEDVYFEWKISAVNEPTEIAPPDTDTVIVGG